MDFLEIFLIAIALSMDAFAVSICKGLKMKKLNLKHTALIALFFGGFQALMPLLGWFAGKSFEKFVTSFDHWIAFGLLAFIGIKMICDSFKNEEDDNCDTFDIKELFLMAVATSIDALAVGITFALDKTVIILPAVSIIGVTTFVLAAIGVFIGYRFGSRYKNKAELAGGIILVLIGVKILLEDLKIIDIW